MDWDKTILLLPLRISFADHSGADGDNNATINKPGELTKLKPKSSTKCQPLSLDRTSALTKIQLQNLDKTSDSKSQPQSLDQKYTKYT